MNERIDIELVTLACEGDKDAFGLLVQRYQETARRLAWRLVNERECANDLMQEAILQAYLSLDRLRDPARFKGWLCGIVLNVCRTYLRNRKADFCSLEAMTGGLQFNAVPFSNTAATPEKIVEERELHQIVLAAIDTLAAADKDITLRFYYDQLSLQEIAAIQGISTGAVKVRLHRVRQRLKDRLISLHPEIIPPEQRRKKMIKVTIADVVKSERTDEQGNSYPLYVIVLQDEAGKRALPIWIGPNEGTSIVMGLNNFSMPRPLTYTFFASLLQAVNARVEEVRIETLKGNTFYSIVKIRCGKTVKEVDARPSDAIALAVHTVSPIYAAEDVLETGGMDISKSAGVSPEHKGVESILGEVEEIQQQMQSQLRKKISPEEFAKARDELIATVFGGDK